MAKKIVANIKLQIPAGKANPSPPIGPALSPHGVNIMEFCKSFNSRTQLDEDTIIPVVITVYADRSFSFITKTPPVAILLRKTVGITRGSAMPTREKVGIISIDKIKEIAQKKINDLNTSNIDKAIKTIIGTARSMGIEVM